MLWLYDEKGDIVTKRFIWIGLIVVILAGLLGYKFYADHNQALSSDIENNQIAKEYDVIVIGGEPEGVAAAVSAARNGAKTLLVEKREELGGLFTYGMLNFLDIPQGATMEVRQ